MVDALLTHIRPGKRLHADVSSVFGVKLVNFLMCLPITENLAPVLFVRPLQS